MAQKTMNFALHTDRAALNDLTRTLKGVAAERPTAGAPEDTPTEIELRVADLVSDPNGEIVFFNDSGARTIGITANAPVVADGRAAKHVTAAGADVSGYRFVTFEDGPTLYFEETVDLVVRAPERT